MPRARQAPAVQKRTQKKPPRALIGALVSGPPPRASALVVAVLIAAAGYATNATDTPVMGFGPGLLAALLAPLWLSTPLWLVLDLVLALATARIAPASPLHAASSFLVILGAALLAGRLVSLAGGQVQSIQHLMLRQTHAHGEQVRAAQEREQELAKQLAYASEHDALTGVRTRQSMLRALDEHIARRTETGVLVLALASFADVNETLGPVIGDQALVEAGRRLSSAARAIDLVARLGGDEFVVLLPQLTPAQALAMASALQKSLHEPVVIDGHTVPLRSRAGLACSDGTLVASELVARAEQTARSATPGAAVVVWEGDLESHGASRIERETDMRRGLAADEFFLLYQPLISTTTGTITAVEALVRWRHPQRGMVPPDDFIPLSEKTGLIVPLGLSVLEKACAQLREWVGAGAGMHLTVAVNVSARQLLEADFVVRVRQALWNSGVNPRQIVLELTESMLVDDNKAAIDVLWQLRALGVRLAIDDFGTGYSSLARLGEMPVDELKIDKSFVDRLGAAAHDSTALVTAAVAMGHGLALEVVAEGVETTQQASFLASIGCDLLQGYLLGKPQPADQISGQLGHRLMTSAPAFPEMRPGSAMTLTVEPSIAPSPPPVPQVIVPKVAPS
ncbi:MAG: diguanylate cyclase/phosphodiesterase [Frankiales bacterium]|nr:diguanylate cyclase/phosphodiesterase [Frankiales bacterium]